MDRILGKKCIQCNKGQTQKIKEKYKMEKHFRTKGTQIKNDEQWQNSPEIKANNKEYRILAKE